MLCRKQTSPNLCTGAGQVQLRREQTLCAGPSRSLSVQTDTPRAGLM